MLGFPQSCAAGGYNWERTADQGREFENKVMHELCLLGGSHKTKRPHTIRRVTDWLSALIEHC